MIICMYFSIVIVPFHVLFINHLLFSMLVLFLFQIIYLIFSFLMDLLNLLIYCLFLILSLIPFLIFSTSHYSNLFSVIPSLHLVIKSISSFKTMISNSESSLYSYSDSDSNSDSDSDYYYYYYYHFLN